MIKLLFSLCMILQTSIFGDCIYSEPIQLTQIQTTFFQEIIDKSNDSKETFQSILSLFNENKESFYRFEFKYPIGDKKTAEIFFKVMQIKGQEAHRFVPVFSDCQFLFSKHLGYLRKAMIINGPTIWEHTLVDKKSKSIIFIEEQEILPNGDRIDGVFASINTIIEEDGKNYFSGTYLYPDHFTLEQAIQSKQMFLKTYENMMDFMKKENVDFIYQQLHAY